MARFFTQISTSRALFSFLVFIFYFLYTQKNF